MLTVEYYWHCVSAEKAVYKIEGSKDTYTVSYDHNYINTKGQGWHCPCQGFTFRKTCKHVKEAQAKHCGWLQFVSGGDAVDVPENDEYTNGKACPECGGPVASRGWGV